MKKTKPTTQTDEAARPSTVSIDRRLKGVNRWREQFNPLKGLTISKAIALIQQAKRGVFSEVMWTCEWMEEMDPTLFCLVERRISALQEMDWDIKTVRPERRGKDWDEKLAEDQAACLREAYNRVTNLQDALEAMALATFRGFSILQIERSDSGKITLGEFNHWNVVRDGLQGDWYWNPDASEVTYKSLPPENRIDPATCIIRQKRRALDMMALPLFIRSSSSVKNWSAFLEIFGIPQPIIIGPPGVPPSREPEYAAAAQSVADGGSGYLPNGSDVKYPTADKSSAPFKDKLEWAQKQIVLAGTGGMLTMLNEATGMNSGQSDSHTKVFATLAKAEAKSCSANLNAQFDARELEAEFSGKPALAYFEFAAREEANIGGVIDEIGKLTVAGYRVPAAEVEERTGYGVEEPDPVDKETLAEDSTETAEEPVPVTNSRRITIPGHPGFQAFGNKPDPVGDSFVTATATVLQPLRNKLADALAGKITMADLETAMAEDGAVAKEVEGGVQTVADALQTTMAGAMADGLTSRGRNQGKKASKKSKV